MGKRIPHDPERSRFIRVLQTAGGPPVKYSSYEQQRDHRTASGHDNSSKRTENEPVINPDFIVAVL
jgi:hypothetical protein